MQTFILFVDHLPGGKHFSQDPSPYDKTLNTPKHNKLAESVFAFSDHLMRTKPSISVIACEAYVMSSFNRTMQWLDAKINKEVDTLLSQARNESKDVMRKFRERHRDTGCTSSSCQRENNQIIKVPADKSNNDNLCHKSMNRQHE